MARAIEPDTNIPFSRDGFRDHVLGKLRDLPRMNGRQVLRKCINRITPPPTGEKGRLKVTVEFKSGARPENRLDEPEFKNLIANRDAKDL